MDDGDFFGGDVIAGDEGVAGIAAVRDDVADGGERTAEKGRQIFSGAHRADDGGAGKLALESAGVAVRHAAEAEDDVGRGGGDGAREAGREPIKVRVERLEDATSDRGREGRGELAAGAEGEERRRVASDREGVGEEDGLPLGSPAAQEILEDSDFHCPARGRGDGVRFTS